MCFNKIKLIDLFGCLLRGRAIGFYHLPRVTSGCEDHCHRYCVAVMSALYHTDIVTHSRSHRSAVYCILPEVDFDDKSAKKDFFPIRYNYGPVTTFFFCYLFS